ncbi:MAG: aspartate kinase [Tepidanaerobacteraceae bacterium]
MKIIVQKFGGTSLATKDRIQKAAEKVIEAKKKGYDVVVVVSAMGRSGDPYATDTLLDYVKSSVKKVSSRELDLLLNCGEIISAVVFSQSLESMGFKSTALTGAQAGIITDSSFNCARILRVKADRVLENLKEGKIVVVTGFQGITDGGDLTTLGRGGSDTTAAALGSALNAEFIEIFTDVDGVKTADPRIVKDARTLQTATYYEICQLAHQGAKVIHPRAVEIAMQQNIPLKIRSTFSDTPGTLVTSCRNNLKEIELISERLITGITYMTNLTQIKIDPDKDRCLDETQLKIFRSLADANISIDFINVSPHKIKFTVKESDNVKVRQIIKDLGLNSQINTGCAMVSIVGANIMGVPGVMAKIMEALVKENVQILQTADSYTSIWCLVKQENLEKAIIALHKEFELY